MEATSTSGEGGDALNERLRYAETAEEVFQVLLSLGFSQGDELTQSQVVEAFAETEIEIEPGGLEDWYVRFQESGILIIEDIPEQLSPEQKPPDLEADSGSMDGLQKFLSDIGKTALLTKREEVKLAINKDKGILARAIIERYATGMPADKEQRKFLRPVLKDNPGMLNLTYSELDQVVNIGRRDHKHMIDANMRLVVSIAKHYRNQGLGFRDLIQEGAIGLNRAVDKFDWRRDLKFSTYATWWIRQAVARALADKGRTIRLPVHVVERLHKVNRAERTLMLRLGRNPTDEEIADESKVPLELVKEVRTAARTPLSLEKPVGEDGESTIADIIGDLDLPGPEIETADRLKKELLLEVVGYLPERDKKVLELRYGLGGSEPMTLEQIALAIDPINPLTRERIRQIETEALKYLATLPEAQGLRTLQDE